MHITARQNWRIGTAESHVAVMRNADRRDLAALAHSYDWSAHPETVLGWVMAQKCIDLGMAIGVFFDGGPERFNYLPKRAVPRCYGPGARALDNICLRINSGFYLPCVEGDSVDFVRLSNWLAAQRADRAEGACGRWVLDEAIVARLDDGAARQRASAREEVSAASVTEAVSAAPVPQAATWHDRLRAMALPGLLCRQGSQV